MSPAVGALLWTASSWAENGELDLHISATHLFDPAASLPATWPPRLGANPREMDS